MHADELDIDVSLVRRLLAAQLPEWAALPLEPVASTGTVNAIFRLGDDMAVRLPRVEWWAAALEKELHWLPRLAPQLPLAVPEPLATGEPGEGYPWHWAVYRWLAGEEWSVDRVRDLSAAAAELARFVSALQRIKTSGAPSRGRGDRSMGRGARGAGLGRAAGVGARRPVARQRARVAGPPERRHRLGLPERG